MDARHALEGAAEKQIEAAARLREWLGSDAEDAELLADMIEGQTGLFEIVDRIIEALDEDQLLIDGIKSRTDELAERKGRIERRVELRRALIEKAMDIAGLKTMQRPLATVSLSARKPQLSIADESAIPADFWKAGKPTLDRAALKAALEAGQDVPGVTLTNAAPSLTMRRK